MDTNIEDFRQHFELLSDETLLNTNRDDLVDAAKAVYDQEIAKRGLHQPAPLEGTVITDDVSAVQADEEAETEEQPQEGLISVGSFTIVDEARLARGLLEGAGIPCGLANEKSALGALHLMVPESYHEAALEMLGGEISEEDLAAQAEEAGGGWHED